MSVETELEKRRKKQDEFDAQLLSYLDRLSRVYDLAALLTIIREAAAWAATIMKEDRK